MIHMSESDQFKTLFDRNGVKIHIGEQALIKVRNHCVTCQIIGYSRNYKYIYLANDNHVFKRHNHNIVIIKQLYKWKN